MRRAALALLLCACTQPAPPKPVVKAVPHASVVVAPSAKPPPPAPPPPPATIPELAWEPFLVNDKPLKRVFAIEGATIVATDNVVGYIDGDRVEWIAKVPKSRAWANNIISHVDGKYLDRIDVIMESDNGRANSPVWLPLTGKGTLHEEASGMVGEMVEARVGDSVLLATHSGGFNDRILTVRGPSLTRKFKNAKDCKGYYALPSIRAEIDQHAAVRPAAFQATASGTLVALGDRCGEDEAYAEVWPAGSTTSTLMDLTAHWTRVGYRSAILRDGQDALWFFGGEFMPILHFANGEVKAQPGPGAPIDQAFLSTKGQLHVRVIDQILRLEANGTWEPVARLATVPDHFLDLVMGDKDRFWASDWTNVYRLRETKQVAAERPCPGWFVYLDHKDVTSSKPNAAALSKILAEYPKHEGKKLLSRAGYPWASGVSFTTKAEADEFLAYAAPKVPKEKAAVFCYSSAGMKDLVPK